MKLKQSWKDYIKAEIRRDITGRTIKGEILMAVACWDLDGFANELEAKNGYQEYMTACQIRTYCRRNKITTRRGSKHAFDCRHEHHDLWQMVAGGAMDNETTDGIRWSYRTVDGLKNLYIQF